MLKDGVTAVQLKAATDAYAQFVKVGTVVTDITQAATIKAAVNAEGHDCDGVLHQG